MASEMRSTRLLRFAVVFVLVPGSAERYRVSVVAFDLVMPRGGR